MDVLGSHSRTPAIDAQVVAPDVRAPDAGACTDADRTIPRLEKLLLPNKSYRVGSARFSWGEVA